MLLWIIYSTYEVWIWSTLDETNLNWICLTYMFVALCFLGLVIEIGPIIISSGFVYCGLDQQHFFSSLRFKLVTNRPQMYYLTNIHYSMWKFRVSRIVNT